MAQEAPVLGDEMIFFVNGPNVLIPTVAAEVVNDPLDPGSGNLVAKFNNGSWTEPAFDWDRSVGVDMSANVGAESGKSAEAKGELHFKMLVDPANAGKSVLKLTFFDKSDDPTDSREIAEGLPEPPDYRARLDWVIPENMRDGEWHDIVLQLPPATIAELDSAKADKNVDGTPIDVPLDSLSKLWSYGGAWASGYGVACCGSDYDADPSTDPLWTEFQWDGVASVALHFDFDEGGADGPGGPIYLDDVFIGDADTDLSAAENPPSAQSNISLSGDGPINVVAWEGSDDFGGYNVYASEDPITDVTADEVVGLATLAFDAAVGKSSFEFRHNFQAPHPTLAAGNTLYYAVTSTSLFGVENTDVSASTDALTNDLASQPFIQMLTSDQADVIFGNIEAGIASGEGFPEGLRPFSIEGCEGGFDGFGPCVSGEQVSWSDAAGPPDNADDNSGQFWVGISGENELFIYGEIRDDILEPTLETETGGEAWQHDSAELGIGTYSVESALLGTDHQSMERGERPDHQLRFSFHEDANSDIFTSTWESNSLMTDGAAGGDIVGAVTIFDIFDDASGKVTGVAGAPIGWKFLSIVPLAQIVGAESGDAVFDPPADDEIKLIPFTFAINDGDGAGREHQTNWSIKANVNNSWWNTPAQWPSVAVAGASVSTASEDAPELPIDFSLEQNYPNPFNPSTAIRFSIPSSEKVSLTVYNVLGHRVATLIAGEQMSAGSHSVSFDAANLASGMYTYRLEAGVEFVQTRRMLLVK